MHFVDGIDDSPRVRLHLFLAQVERLLHFNHRLDVSLGHAGLHQVDVFADLKVLQMLHHTALLAELQGDCNFWQVCNVDIYINILKDHLDSDRQLCRTMVPKDDSEDVLISQSAALGRILHDSVLIKLVLESLLG